MQPSKMLAEDAYRERHMTGKIEEDDRTVTRKF